MTNIRCVSIHPLEPEPQPASPALSLCLLLRELAGVIRSLSEAQFTTRPVGVIQSSVGAHVRHCLDHVSALVQAVDTGELNYDQRTRGTAVENSRFAAIDLIKDLDQRAANITTLDLELPVIVSVVLCNDEVIDVQSSVGREMAFVINHTIHHNAMLDTMVRMLGGKVPERFGYAPSTVAHLEREAATCAR